MKAPRMFNVWVTNHEVLFVLRSVYVFFSLGSHNSFTSSLTPTSDVAPDAPGAAKFLDNYCCCCNGCVYRWAVTQDLTTEQQLQAGIRYFDLRVASRQDTNDLYLVHSLYAQDVPTFLNNVRDFLMDHPKEVVLLDFNHFYEMTQEQHEQLLDTIGSILGDKLWPRGTIDNTTLANMWAGEKQVECTPFKKITTQRGLKSRYIRYSQAV